MGKMYIISALILNKIEIVKVNNRMIRIFRFILLSGICLITSSTLYSQTSWRGTTSTAWSTAGNWTAGVPTATVDAIIGDANFTGAFQPSVNANSTCKSVTIGTGTKASTLTLGSGRNLTVSGDITIGTNGTITHSSNCIISLTGNWNKTGTYTASNTSATLTFAGTTTQTLTGATTCYRLIINAGSTLVLINNITINNNFNARLNINGTLDPQLNVITLGANTGQFTVGANGRIIVRAATFAGNYTGRAISTLNGTSIVEYAGSINQTVGQLNATGYGRLWISGNSTKTLNANISFASATAAQGQMVVRNGSILDLVTFTADRGNARAGGYDSLYDGAYLRIGGTNTFPANFANHYFGTSSTTEYYGTNQTVSLENYGNLRLSSSAGAVTKTMPATAMTINGNFAMVRGNGTSVTATAGASITVNGVDTVGASCTFSGGTFNHTLNNNLINAGTFNAGSGIVTISGTNLTNSGIFNGNTSPITVNCTNISNSGTMNGNTGSITLAGAGAAVSGAGTYSLNDLIVSASGVTIDAATSLGIAGNLSTSGSGTLTHTTGGAGIITMSGAAKTISGTGIILDDLTGSGSITMNNSMEVAGNLNVTGTFNGAASTVLTMSGTGKTMSGAGTITLFTLSVTNSISATSSATINGNLSGGVLTATAGTFTFTGAPSSLSGTANLFNTTVNGGSTLQITSGSTLGIASTFTLTGSLDVTAGNNTVNYNGTGAQSIVATTYHHLILSNGNTKTAPGAVTTNGDLTIGTTTSFAAGTFTHTIIGNWTNNGTFTPSTGTVQLTGSSDATVGGTSTTTFSTLIINKSLTTNTVTGATGFNVGTLNVATGNLAMGSNTVTITSTRTGNGIITGIITHAHAFSTGVEYWFESPNNFIVFSSVSGVTSVTDTVTLGSVLSFPFSGSINRKYSFAVPVGTYTLTLRLHYLDGELNGNNESTMQLWHFNGTAWVVSGKTANDATNNWVEQSGLTNIINKWTISDDQNVVQWNGGSTIWNSASNWTIAQGSPSTPPSANDIVQIGKTAFGSQPTISTSVSIKNIVFGSAQAATLTIGSGGSLTLSGINGEWSANATHSVDVGTQTLTVNGDLVLSDGTAGHAINLNVGSGSATITGSLSESGGSNITLGSGNLSLAGDFNYSNGTFTGGTSTFTYNGSTDQIVGPVTYYNLTINKSAGTANIGTATTVNGNLSLSTGGTVSVNAALNVSGNVSIGNATTFNANGSSLRVGGNWVRTGTFTSGTSTLTFNGTGTQTIDATTFNNLTINKPNGAATLNGSLVINGNLTLSQGTLTLSTLTADRSALAGIFQMDANTVLRLAGTNNFPSNYSTYNLNPTSTVEYYGSVAQTVRGSITYGNLTINNSGAIATLGGAITTAGNILLQSGSSLNGSSYTLIDQGNWTNDGTFTASTGTVQLSGTTKTLGGNNATTFNNLTVSGSYTPSKDITVNNTLSISATGNYAAGGTSIILGGSVSNAGTFSSSGIITFSGTQAQNIALNSGFSSTGTVNFNGTIAPVFSGSTPPQYATLNINNAGGVSPTTGWTVNGPFTIASGASFNGGAATQTFHSGFTNNGTISSSGVLLFNPTTASSIILYGTLFSSTGTLDLSGSGQLTFTGNSPTINSLTISNTNAAGVTLPAAWTIPSDLTIGAGAKFNGGTFNYSLGGSFTNNGTFDGQTSTITMTGIGETISGTGTTFNNLTVASGASITANSGFSISGNYTGNGSLDATGQNITFSGSSPSTISGTLNPITLDVLTIAKNSEKTTLAQNINGINLLNISSGILDLSSFAIAEDAGLGTLQIDANAIMRIGGTNTLPAFTTNDLDPASIVEYYSNSAQTIAATATYGGVLLSGTGTKSLNSSATIAGDLTISSGTPLTMSGSITLSIGGNWQDNGTLTAGTGTVQLTGSSKSLTGTTTFNNLAISGSYTNNNTISINNTLSGSGTLTQGANSNLIITGSSITLANLLATASGNTISYNGASAQSILAIPYYNLTFNNAGVKTAGSSFTVNGELVISLGSNLTINNAVTVQVLGKVTTAGLLNNNGQLTISD